LAFHGRLRDLLDWWLHQDEGNSDAARDVLQVCVAGQPREVQALPALARLEETAGAPEVADAARAEAMAADSAMADPMVARAKLATRRGDAAAAEAPARQRSEWLQGTRRPWSFSRNSPRRQATARRQKRCPARQPPSAGGVPGRMSALRGWAG
jgi:hypothetical protein